MKTDSLFDNPYEGNLLTAGIGPILSEAEVFKRLSSRPPTPKDVSGLSKLERLHRLLCMRDLHIPSVVELDIFQSLDLLIRQGYRYRDPAEASTWQMIGGEPGYSRSPRAPASAAIVVGYSGVGKTEAILRCLRLYPRVIIPHEHFPMMEGPHHQVLWLSTDVPESGRLADMAAALMHAWNQTTRSDRFGASLSKSRARSQELFDEWRQVALSHSLGLLHLDEVQNFFKLATKEARRKGARTGAEAPPLSVQEDVCLKSILTLTNTWQIPVMMSGTPDGVAALAKRLSTIQRVTTFGYHRMDRFADPSDEHYRKHFLPALLRYQYVKTRLEQTEEFAHLLLELTAGVPRIMIALWIAAHRIAFRRGDDSLRQSDFVKASQTLLEPLQPAILALRSGDPELMSRYEDLLPRDDVFWGGLWRTGGGK